MPPAAPGQRRPAAREGWAARQDPVRARGALALHTGGAPNRADHTHLRWASSA